MNQWPAELRRLATQHTPAVVYAAGLAALGYPPTWADTGAEFGRVSRYLSTRSQVTT